jgi:hypothetical protein
MGTHSIAMEHGSDDANRRLVRFFSICLGSLVFIYSLFAVRLFIENGTFAAAEWALMAFRVALGIAALIMIIYPTWLAHPLEREIDAMGDVFEAEFTKAGAKEKVRLIVLVTMVSLLLELVMIRWLASVFPVFSFFKNFTLLACFLGLGAGYAVADKQRCAPALVLPMLALFVGIITLMRYDISVGNDLFAGLPMREQTSISIWMDQLEWFELFRHSAPLYILLGMSFVLCACICYPVGQLCGKLLGTTEPLKAYGAVRDEPVLAAASDLVHRRRRCPAVFRAGARHAAAHRGCKLLPAAHRSGLAGADRVPEDLFALSTAGTHVEGRRPHEHPLRRRLLSEGLQPL